MNIAITQCKLLGKIFSDMDQFPKKATRFWSVYSFHVQVEGYVYPHKSYATTVVDSSLLAEYFSQYGRLKSRRVSLL